MVFKKYVIKYTDQVRKLTQLGISLAEVAEVIDVPLETLEHWKAESPDFQAAVHEGQLVADGNVIDGLYKRATGFSVEETQSYYDKHGELKETESTRYFPPDVEAGKFWLKNRHPEHWKDKQEIDVRAIVVQVVHE